MCQFPEVDSVGEGDMVCGVPVETVAIHVEGNRVDQTVDWGDHLHERGFRIST